MKFFQKRFLPVSEGAGRLHIQRTPKSLHNTSSWAWHCLLCWQILHMYCSPSKHVWLYTTHHKTTPSNVHFWTTITGNILVIKILLLGKSNTALQSKQRKFIYNEHFMCSLFVGCHDSQKYWNTKISHQKNSPSTFSKLRYVKFHDYRHALNELHTCSSFEACKTAHNGILHAIDPPYSIHTL